MPANVLNETGRTDGRNLFHEAEKRGYQLVRTAQELEQVPFLRQRWIFGLFAPDQFVFSSLREGRTAMPNLAMMTRQAIRNLQYPLSSLQSPYNLGGYFLVVEHGLVATAAKNNWTQAALDEVAELDAAVGVALEYGGPKSLVLVTNNYNLGALESFREEAEVQSSSSLAAPTPTYEWLTGSRWGCGFPGWSGLVASRLPDGRVFSAQKPNQLPRPGSPLFTPSRNYQRPRLAGLLWPRCPKIQRLPQKHRRLFPPEGVVLAEGERREAKGEGL